MWLDEIMPFRDTAHPVLTEHGATADFHSAMVPGARWAREGAFGVCAEQTCMSSRSVPAPLSSQGAARAEASARRSRMRALVCCLAPDVPWSPRGDAV